MPNKFYRNVVTVSSNPEQQRLHDTLQQFLAVNNIAYQIYKKGFGSAPRKQMVWRYFVHAKDVGKVLDGLAFDAGRWRRGLSGAVSRPSSIRDTN